MEHITGLCEVLIFAKFTRFGQFVTSNCTNTCSLRLVHRERFAEINSQI